MRKIVATFYKEWLLLKRDVAGLLLLVFMPALLMVVMALVQDAPFKDYQDRKFPILIANEDYGTLARSVITGLKNSNRFIVIDSLNKEPVAIAQLIILIQKGTYNTGLFIPRGASAVLVNKANKLTNSIAASFGVSPALPVVKGKDSTQILVYFDPVTKPQFKASIRFALDKIISQASAELLVSRLQQTAKGNNPMADSLDFKGMIASVSLKEASAGSSEIPQAAITSVQHNVPAWAIFGMFFIIIPLAGHIIQERQDGSTLRLATIPGAANPVIFGRLFFYIIICLLQFVFMMFLGVWLMPLIGLQRLYLGHHLGSLFLIVFAIALAAVAYGCLIGAVFKTTRQALPFAAISIVIFSALGGIWVPIDLLPVVMQRIAVLSPLHWSLSAVNNTLVRDEGLASSIEYMGALILFSILALLPVFGIVRYKNTSSGRWQP